MAHLVKDAKLPDEPFFVGTFRLHLTTTTYCLLICPILSDEYLLIPHSSFRIVCYAPLRVMKRIGVTLA